MADIINVQPEQNPNPTGESQLLAGKYKTEEDLQKGVLELLKNNNGDKNLETIYKELESNIGKQKQQETPPDNNETTPNLDIPSQDEAEQTLEKAGLNFEEFEKEFMEKGELSEESYNKLINSGIPETMVDAYIAGVKATAEQQVQAVYTITGNEENYNAMIQWAAANLSESEKSTFNEAVNQNVEYAKFAVEALYSRYVKANGNPPKLVKGITPAAGNSDVYQSRSQLTKDMNNPLYQSDPAFRKSVMDKLARSNIF